MFNLTWGFGSAFVNTFITGVVIPNSAALGPDKVGYFVALIPLTAAALSVSQRHLAHCFSAVSRPFSAVFPPLFCAVRLPGAKTERTGEKWRKMGEI